MDMLIGPSILSFVERLSVILYRDVSFVQSFIPYQSVL